jgi:3-deoxy-7-phosphoheptulonate synthase/chorismate mutase
MNEFVKEKRREIDELDRSLVEMILQRLDLSKALIEEKISRDIEVFDPQREKEITEKLKKEFDGRISGKLIEKAFRLILDEAKNTYYQEDDIISTKQPILIAGPCSIESEEQIERIAAHLSSRGIKYLRGGAHKPRTSPGSFQGLGDVGFDYLKQAAQKHGMKTVTEVLTDEQLVINYDKIDIVQIGSRNMTSYGLLKNIGSITAKDEKPVLLKRGQTSTIKEFIYAAEYILDAGNPNVILCLRGIRTFEQIDSELRNTADLSAIIELKSKTDLKVIFDPSHASGNSQAVLPLSKAAMELGADGIMVEAHYSPKDSVSDAKQTIDFEQVDELTEIVRTYRWKS